MAQINFYAMLSRMRYINRWGLMRNSDPENLSDHTLDVAYLTHALCVIQNTRLGGKVDTGAAVLHALYHDCCEIITGDMPTPIKYQSDNIRTAYKQVEAGANARLLSLLPADLAQSYEPYLADSEDELVAKLVKGADKLSALIKCLEEEKGGNREFVKAGEATLASLKAMNLPAVDIFLEECLPAYRLTLDEL